MTVLAGGTTTAARAVGRWKWPNDRVFLVAITLFAGVIRFLYLSQPTLWNDEARTFARVCGTQGELLEQLRNDAFGPLHYEIYWLLGRVAKLTPFMMRIVPAVCGTLMVPAIFWLAAELFNRRVARLSAVFAACSAFLLAYSRDAKMYMELWLAITMHVACMLSLARTNRWWLWPIWLISGSAGLWLHATGWVVLALDVLIALAHVRVTTPRLIGLLAGIAVMTAGPIFYIANINRVADSYSAQGWSATGIGWVSARTRRHTPLAQIADTAGTFAFAYGWMEEPNAEGRLSASLYVADVILLSLLAIVFFVAASSTRPIKHWPGTGVLMMFWIGLSVMAAHGIAEANSSRWMRNAQISNGFGGINLATWIVGGLALAISAWLVAKHRQKSLRIPILAATVAFLVWVVFCSMLNDRRSPVTALATITTFDLPLSVPIVIGSLLIATFVTSIRGLFLGIFLMAFAIVTAWFFMQIASSAGIGSIMIPRYLGFFFPAVLIGVAALLWRLQPWMRWTTVSVLLAVNLAQGMAHIFAGSEPPLDKVAMDIVSAGRPDSTTLCYTPDSTRTFGPNATGSILNVCGKYYIAQHVARPISPNEFNHTDVRELVPMRTSIHPVLISRDLQQHPQANRLIFWDVKEPTRAMMLTGQFSTAPEGWVIISQQEFPVRSFWNWGFQYIYRRTECRPIHS